MAESRVAGNDLRNRFPLVSTAYHARSARPVPQQGIPLRFRDIRYSHRNTICADTDSRIDIQTRIRDAARFDAAYQSHGASLVGRKLDATGGMD